MRQLRKVLNYVLYAMVGVSFLTMVGLTCWQVFTRYILQNPSSWSEEMVSYLFAWMALLGASIVVGERGHMNIPIVVERLNIKWRFAGIILVYGGSRITNLAMGQMTSSLGLPIGVFYIVLPLSGVINIVYTILNIVDIVTNFESVRGEG